MFFISIFCTCYESGALLLALFLFLLTTNSNFISSVAWNSLLFRLIRVSPSDPCPGHCTRLIIGSDFKTMLKTMSTCLICLIFYFIFLFRNRWNIIHSFKQLNDMSLHAARDMSFINPKNRGIKQWDCCSSVFFSRLLLASSTRTSSPVQQ